MTSSLLADRAGIAGGDDAAIDQHGDAVGEREHRVHVVLDQHDGDFLPQFLQQRHHARRFGDAEAGHRLVEQQQLRLGGERDREFELALLAVAQFGHRHVGALGEPDPRQRRLRRVAQMLLLAGIAPEAERVAVMRLRRQRDIVGAR